MAKSKAFKAARQAQQEEDLGEMDRLDETYASLLQVSQPSPGFPEEGAWICQVSVCEVQSYDCARVMNSMDAPFPAGFVGDMGLD